MDLSFNVNAAADDVESDADSLVIYIKKKAILCRYFLFQYLFSFCSTTLSVVAIFFLWNLLHLTLPIHASIDLDVGLNVNITHFPDNLDVTIHF